MKRRRTSTELAKALGCSRRTAARWLNDPTFPHDADDDGVRAWRKATTSRRRHRTAHRGQPSANGPQRKSAGTRRSTEPGHDAAAEARSQDLFDTSLDLKRLQIREREFDLALRQGRYELVDERDAREARNKGEVRKALRTIGRRLAPLAEGQPAVRIRQMFEAAVDEALRFWTSAAADDAETGGGGGDDEEDEGQG